MGRIKRLSFDIWAVGTSGINYNTEMSDTSMNSFRYAVKVQVCIYLVLFFHPLSYPHIYLPLLLFSYTLFFTSINILFQVAVSVETNVFSNLSNPANWLENVYKSACAVCFIYDILYYLSFISMKIF